MTENEKTELFDKWYDENYDEWAEIITFIADGYFERTDE